MVVEYKQAWLWATFRSKPSQLVVPGLWDQQLNCLASSLSVCLGTFLHPADKKIADWWFQCFSIFHWFGMRNTVQFPIVRARASTTKQIGRYHLELQEGRSSEKIFLRAERSWSEEETMGNKLQEPPDLETRPSVIFDSGSCMRR